MTGVPGLVAIIAAIDDARIYQNGRLAPHTCLIKVNRRLFANRKSDRGRGFRLSYGVGRGGGVGRGLGVGTNLGVGVCLGVALGVVVVVAVAVGVAVAVAVDVAVAVGVGVGVAVVVFTVIVTGSEAIPFATTSRELLPVSAAAGTSKFVETFSAPVATPIVLCPCVRA